MDALFAGLTLRAWTARKYDKAISIEVAEMHNAPATAGRYNKRLMERSGTYARILEVLGGARSFHYKNTLASHLDGWRVLTGANFEKYSDGIRQRKGALQALVEQLVSEWPELIEAERRRLNGMFQEEDYPPTDTLRDRFGIEMSLIPLPNAEWFLTSMPDEIRRSVREQAERAREAAVRDLWDKLYQPISRMVERLSQPEAVFRDSLVENLREMLEVLPRLNFAGDRRFESVLERARSLSFHEPQALRQDAALRADVAARAAEIADQMAAFMGASETRHELLEAA